MGVGGKRESKKENKSKADPPSTVGGLEGIDKRVGSWGKKKNEKKEKGAGPAPADLHPPLNKKRWA